MDSSSDANSASAPSPSPAQVHAMAITTDEPAAPRSRMNGGRSVSVSRSRMADERMTSSPRSRMHDDLTGDEAPYPPNVGRRPPPVPPPLAAGRRITSPGGGLQVTLDGKGSWSELARQDATLPTDANCVDGAKQESSGGMFGFLRGKKGRAHSPKPKERGVLGKEGARVVIA